VEESKEALREQQVDEDEQASEDQELYVGLGQDAVHDDQDEDEIGLEDAQSAAYAHRDPDEGPQRDEDAREELLEQAEEG
jgi:hypothetical protein